MVLLVVIGFCIYGPQVLLVGTAPADLARRGTSAAAAGFVNFMGYMGAATGDVITGYYSSPEHGGWQVAIYIWAGWAFAGACAHGRFVAKERGTMQVIVIGAGRGRRLMPTTADAPKCFAEVAGQRLLDWAVEAFDANGLDRHLLHRRLPDRQGAGSDYPQFTFRQNRRLGKQQHPRLAVLRRGRDGRRVHLLLQRHAVHAGRRWTAGGQRRTTWRSASTPRGSPATKTAPTIRPTTPRKVTVAGGRVTPRPSRKSPSTRLTASTSASPSSPPAGAARLREHYHRVQANSPAGPGAKPRVFEKAYKILLFQEMIEAGERFCPRRYARRLHRSRYAAGFRIRPADTGSPKHHIGR